MFDLSMLKKYDPSFMYKIYDKWPQHADESFNSSLEPVNFKDVDHIVFSGMGGSGAIGDLFSAILSKTPIHVSVVKGYELPKTVNSNSLVIATSVSGNTEETMTVLDSANKLDSNIIAFSSGGKIESFCSKNKIEFRNIPELHSPRASFVRYVYSILKVLNSIIPIERNDILHSITEMKTVSEKISSSNLNDTNPSLNLASWITEIPLIYYPRGLESAAIRFKNSIQENAKSHAMIEDVIETCHNGIVSFESHANIKPILIEGVDDHIKTKERWSILKEYFERNTIDYREVFSIEGDILSKLINLIYVLDYSTIYLAVMYKIDPTPVRSIDFIKSKLK